MSASSEAAAEDECEAMIARLVDIMRGLPLAEGRAATVEVEVEAEALWIAAMLTAGNDAPSARPLGTVGVKRELRDAMRLANELHNALAGLHRTTLDALAAGRPSRHPIRMRHDLVSLFKAGLVAWATVRTNPPPRVRGRRPKRHAAEVTEAAARAFERLTGKPPTRSVDDGREGGKFLEFLTSVFAALGIEARPGGQIKTHMELIPRKELH